MKEIFSYTYAVCVECDAKIQARIIAEDNRVYLEKCCPEHGISQELISSDADWYNKSRNYVKPKQLPLDYKVKSFVSCPESCGSCSEHQQHTCLPVIEITQKCNLDCPVCLKDLEKTPNVSVEEFSSIIDDLLRYEGKVDVINISGGEPLLHPDFDTLLDIAYQKNITQVTVSTNGEPLLHSAKIREAFKRTGSIVALQFDGFDPNTFIKLRGEDISDTKQKIIALLESEDINYSLVSTISSRLNDKEVTKIVDFFFDSKAISLMFQPVTYVGSATDMYEGERITTVDVVKEIEKSKFVKEGDFNPLPCSHFSCFTLAYYIKLGDNNYISLKDFLADEYLDIIANKTLPGLDAQGLLSIRNRIYELWSAADTSSLDSQVLERIKGILEELSSCACDPKKTLSVGMNSMKAVFIHEFMDKHTFDFARIVKCCNPYAYKDGSLIPMCVQNVFHQ